MARCNACGLSEFECIATSNLSCTVCGRDLREAGSPYLLPGSPPDWLRDAHGDITSVAEMLNAHEYAQAHAQCGMRGADGAPIAWVNLCPCQIYPRARDTVHEAMEHARLFALVHERCTGCHRRDVFATIASGVPDGRPASPSFEDPSSCLVANPSPLAECEGVMAVRREPAHRLSPGRALGREVPLSPLVAARPMIQAMQTAAPAAGAATLSLLVAARPVTRAMQTAAPAADAATATGSFTLLANLVGRAMRVLGRLVRAPATIVMLTAWPRGADGASTLPLALTTTEPGELLVIDGHGPHAFERPVHGTAYQLVGADAALLNCCRNPVGRAVLQSLTPPMALQTRSQARSTPGCSLGLPGSRGLMLLCMLFGGVIALCSGLALAYALRSVTRSVSRAPLDRLATGGCVWWRRLVRSRRRRLREDCCTWLLQSSGAAESDVTERASVGCLRRCRTQSAALQVFGQAVRITRFMLVGRCTRPVCNQLVGCLRRNRTHLAALQVFGQAVRTTRLMLVDRCTRPARSQLVGCLRHNRTHLAALQRAQQRV